ncbi:MAG: DUF4159 domain-containing protein [Limisphaerales bacterium]
MRRRPAMPTLTCVGIGLTLAASLALAQFRFGNPGGPRNNRPSQRQVPTWTLQDLQQQDHWTFARIEWDSVTRRRSQTWETDFPDSDLNFSYRLQNLTSMVVNPDGIVIRLTDERLHTFPFIWMSGVGGLGLSNMEVTALRNYLNAGGFLWVDDFWGEQEWDTFYEVIKRVFPDREPVELPLQHPIFTYLYRLHAKPQIPNVGHALRYRDSGITWERPDAKEPHYRAILDDNDRIMVMINHNTDMGDGWEEETTNPYYFTEFSEKSAYPLGINILLYVMTH